MRRIIAALIILQFSAASADAVALVRRPVQTRPGPAIRKIVANEMPGRDLGAKINAADAALGAGAGEIVVYPAAGTAGSIDTQVTVSSNHTLRFFPGTYPSNYQDPGPDGIIRLKSNSRVVGAGPGTVLRESSKPTADGAYNHWTVIINYDGSLDNDAATDNVHISDLTIEGAAASYNSTPQAISLGNCRGCSVERVRLRGTKSIGIQAGGGSSKGYSATDVRIADNELMNVASQSLACVNCVDVTFARNRIINPGPTSSKGGPPGNVPIDLEPNAPTDKMRNVRVEDNVIDASGSLTNCGGGTPCTLHGINVQNMVAVPAANYSVVVRGNRIIGAQITDPIPHIVGTGIWINGAQNTVVERNFVQRTYDGIKFTSTPNFRMVGNEVVSTGFTANFAVLIEGTNVSGIVEANTVRVDSRSALAAGEDASIVETATSGAGVTYRLNKAGGIGTKLPGSRVLK